MSSDTSEHSEVYEISDEIESVFNRLEKKFRDVDLEIFVVFRCLPDELERKTFRRFDKKENVLYLDITVSEDKYEKISKEEQRNDLSHTFYNYLKETLIKYKFPGLDVNAFMESLKTLGKNIGWFKAEV